MMIQPQQHQHHDVDEDEDTVQAYHEYAAAAVELSNAHVVTRTGTTSGTSGTGIGWFSVTRSIRDMDENQRRLFLYQIPLVSLSFVLPHDQDQDMTGSIAHCHIPPPQELSPEVAWRLPSPSGNKTAVLMMIQKKNKDNDGQPLILEIWTQASHVLSRRIPLHEATKRHGNVIWDPQGGGGFGIPAWNHDETVLVYAAERLPPAVSSFFSTCTSSSDKSSIIKGGEFTLGLGREERWGEKYMKQTGLTDLFCVNVDTGKMGKIDNVPGAGAWTTPTTVPTTLGGYALGQPVFSPPNHVNNGMQQYIVYVGWDAGGGGNMPRRLGLTYCSQRPKKIYASPVHHLLQHLASSESDHNENKKKDGSYTVLSPPNIRIATSPRFSPYPSRPHHHHHHHKTKTESYKLVFLAAETSFDTHSGCMGLHALDWHSTHDDDNDNDNSNNIMNMEAIRQSHSIIVRQVSRPSSTSTSTTVGNSNHHTTEDTDTVAGLSFPGIYQVELPRACFISPEYLLLTTHWGSTSKILRVSLSSKEEGDGETIQLVRLWAPLHDDHYDYSSEELLCTVPDGSALIMTREPNQPGRLCRIPASILTAKRTIPPIRLEDMPLRFSFPPMAATCYSPIRQTTQPHAPSSLLDFSYTIQVLRIQSSSSSSTTDGTASPMMQSILLLPSPTKKLQHSNSSKPLPPLIVIPHGGPHSVFTTAYSHAHAFLCGQGGYAILLVNYRGSTGFGQAFLEALPGQIGSMDVSDVVQATRHVIQNDVRLVDPDRVGICGGSHGGFLAAHCTAQHPDLFKVAVMRNPVINIASMVTATDIPDWCHVEASDTRTSSSTTTGTDTDTDTDTDTEDHHYGPPYQYDYRPPTQRQLQRMYEASPIRYIEHVIAPTLVAIGERDERVPPSQGREWYFALRSSSSSSTKKNVPTKLLMYPDEDHALGGAAAEADYWINAKRWFDQHLLGK